MLWIRKYMTSGKVMKLGCFIMILGREDRGRRDSVGNIVYHYEVLDLSYNMTTSSYTNRVTWTPVDVSTGTGKARLLPLLDFLDASLLPFVKSAEVHIPAIMITETF